MSTAPNPFTLALEREVESSRTKLDIGGRPRIFHLPHYRCIACTYEQKKEAIDAFKQQGYDVTKDGRGTALIFRLRTLAVPPLPPTPTAPEHVKEGLSHLLRKSGKSLFRVMRLSRNAGKFLATYYVARSDAEVRAHIETLVDPFDKNPSSVPPSINRMPESVLFTEI
jgi:hypothetical protein